jgi:hypothetical protein
MFALIRGAVAIGHRVELQQLLDRDTARKLLRVGCSVRLKDSDRSGVVTGTSSSSASLQLRSPAQSDAAAVAKCSDVNVPHDQLVIRLKGTVLATRVCNSGTRAAAQAPLPSFEVQVQTEMGDLWVEPFYVAVILKRRQMTPTTYFGQKQQPLPLHPITACPYSMSCHPPVALGCCLSTATFLLARVAMYSTLPPIIDHIAF